jgi:signal transduction histidine kinase
VWTALVTLTAFGSFGVYFGVILRNPDFDLTAFIIRGVYMFVLAVLLGYVGFHDQRLLRELRILASWPQAVAQDAESLARELLVYAGPLLEAPRVILAWTEQDAPWRRVAIWGTASWEHERHSGSAPLVDAGLRDRSFIRSARQPSRTMARERGLPHLVAWSGESLDREFADRFSIRGALSVPIHGESFEGRLFFLDKVDSTLDDLVLAEIVAGIVAARFDAFYLTEQLRHAAATEERIRLARDLHDGVLQSFTGVALRLAAVRRVLRRDPAAAADALQSAQDVLASEQRDLRFFIQELRPTLFALVDERELGARLRDLAQQMEREWDLRVALDVRLADGLPPALCRDLYHLVREALVNAARHGTASAARVRLDAEGQEGIVVTIADNGRGFPFTGEYSGSELAERDLGPKTLRERVQAMQGTLTLQSSDAGAELYIVLPGAA